PAIGGAIAGFGGWRALFWILAGMSIVGGTLALRMLPETRLGDRRPLHPRRLAATYWAVMTHGGFLPLALSTAMIGGGFYLFLAASPFVLKGAGATPAFAGLYYSGVACSIMAGTLSVPMIVRRQPALLKPIATVSLGAGATTILLVAAAGIPLAGLFAAMTLIAFGAGMTTPTLLAEAIEHQRERASAATSLFGAFQMGGSALFSTLAVRLAPSHAIELGLIGALVAGALAIRHFWMAAPAAKR
ncbi:MAG: MFS transporter, partial [Sphingomonadales bacterium]